MRKGSASKTLNSSILICNRNPVPSCFLTTSLLLSPILFHMDPKRVSKTLQLVRLSILPEMSFFFLFLNLNPSFSATSPFVLPPHPLQTLQSWASIVIWHLSVAAVAFSCRLAAWSMGFPLSGVLSWQPENTILSLLFLLSLQFLFVAGPSHSPHSLHLSLRSIHNSFLRHFLPLASQASHTPGCPPTY